MPQNPVAAAVWADGPSAGFESAELVDTVPWRAERRQMYDRVVDVPRLVHTYAVGEALETLRRTPGVLAAVMSGSGATCVGITRDAGVARNAARIAGLIVSMSSTIKLHLAVEDQALYPALQRGANAELARMGQQYQKDMGPIAQAYDAFAKRWNRPESVRRDEQSFRDDANRVLRMVFERMHREDRDFYPRIEGA